MEAPNQDELEPIKQLALTERVYDLNGNRSLDLRGSNFGIRVQGPIMLLPEWKKRLKYFNKASDDLVWMKVRFDPSDDSKSLDEIYRDDDTAAKKVGIQFIDNRFRAYLMVEPEDIPVANLRLLQLAQQRLSQGKRTEWKTLVGKGNNYPSRVSMPPRSSLGYFDGLKINMPRIVLYSDSSSEDLMEVLQGLVSGSWEDIESSRVSKCGGLDKTPKRDNFSSEFVDSSGKTWRSLNWNNFSGPSEAYSPPPAL